VLEAREATTAPTPREARAALSAPTRTLAEPRRGLAASSLSLQRTAGNRATAALIRSGHLAGVPKTRAGDRRLARCAGGCTCGGSCSEDERVDELASAQLKRAVVQRAVTPLQRKPVKSPDVKPIPALQPLEVVAREVADVILKNYSGKGIAAGPVLTAVLDEVTGKIYIGLNSGIPPNVADVVRDAIQAQKDRIAGGEVIVLRTDPLAQGGHSETNAVNQAVRAREDLVKRKVTETDLRTFELHNIWLKGADRKFTAAPRCEHCARITRSVSVTSSVFFAEGGVSGTIKPSSGGGQRNPRVGPGGATGSISGEITVADKPPKAPPPAPTTPPKGLPPASTTPPESTTSTTKPKAPPLAEHPMDVEGAGRISPESVAPAANAVADLLSVILSPYLFPDAEENYRQRLHELRTELEPSIQARIDELLRTETPRIAQLGSGGKPLYITVRLTVWTQQSDVVGAPAGLVSLLIDDVTLGTKNINENEPTHSIVEIARCNEIGHCKSYQLYSIPVPAAIQQEATRRLRGVGASELKSFNELADNLKDSRAKVRMSGAINMARLAKDNGPLRAPAIQQLSAALSDDDDTVRAIAAVALGALDATEAIPVIRRALAKTDDDDKKAVIQKTLDRLDAMQKRPR
jgi:YwqJ-like deaminase